MDVTLEDVRRRSRFLATTYPGGTGDADLQVLVDDASGAVMALTGRAVNAEPGGEGPFDCTLEEVPGSLASSARRAVALYAERFEVARPDAARRIRELRSQASGLASFTAGPYSESYFSPADVVKNQSLDADPAMARDLWGLATACVRAVWARLWNPTGPPPPASSVQSFDWAGDVGILPGLDI